jgi:hypothetical protein
MNPADAPVKSASKKRLGSSKVERLNHAGINGRTKRNFYRGSETQAAVAAQDV